MLFQVNANCIQIWTFILTYSSLFLWKRTKWTTVLKTHLKKLIAKGQTERVIEQLTQLSLNDRILSNEVISLSGRYHQYQRDRLDQIKSQDHLDVEFNRINQKVLDIIERLPSDVKLGATQNKGLLSLSILAFVALIALTVYFLLPSQEQSDIDEPTQTTESTQSTPDLTPATKEPGSQTSFDSTNTKTHIEVKDQAKVGTIVTGDSNKIDIKQDF
ncbi:MAG: hypothetical protein F6K19_05510 [Cyanothece sp. SIO1E1]|nr:hypothetical protein [Cyanothece sp. SIO1E1]